MTLSGGAGGANSHRSTPLTCSGSHEAKHSVRCEYILYRILQQKQSERLVIISFILISLVRY